MKKLLACLTAAALLSGCHAADQPSAASYVMNDNYRTTYEIFVYSFEDSNGDGIGDLNGVRSRLDYIQDTGFDQIWLMPICPSPTYHKYDVMDYYAIDPQYGTMDDFDALVKDCHDRGIRVITDLVLNHSSSQHPYFQDALNKGADSPYYGWYNFADSSREGYAEKNGRYYEARFWEEMPDLNLDNEEVRKEIEKIMAFWIDHGVDGFRLDAVTSYYTGRQDDNIAFLEWLNRAGKAIKPDLYFVAEAWEGQDRYAEYYRSGIDSMFDFAFSGFNGIIRNVLLGSYGADDYANALKKEESLYSTVNPAYVNAPFYTNHDMARSAGYYAGEFGQNKVKLAGALNLLMGGNAFVYYGEEIGMKGSGRDENFRAPMYWNDSPSCVGPQDMENVSMYYPPYEQQKDDPSSIYSYYRKLVQARKNYPAIARGMVFVYEDLCEEEYCVLEKVADEYENVLIVINTSEGEETIPISQLGFGNLAVDLSTGDTAVVLNEQGIVMPPLSAAILTK